MHLMQHQGLSKLAAYDQARRQLYAHRQRTAIRQHIAKEEALATGAYFGKGPLQIGMEIEDAAFENWKAWASRQIDEESQMRAQMMSGPADDEATVLKVPAVTSSSVESGAKAAPGATGMDNVV